MAYAFSNSPICRIKQNDKSKLSVSADSVHHHFHNYPMSRYLWPEYFVTLWALELRISVDVEVPFEYLLAFESGIWNCWQSKAKQKKKKKPKSNIHYFTRVHNDGTWTDVHSNVSVSCDSWGHPFVWNAFRTIHICICSLRNKKKTTQFPVRIGHSIQSLVHDTIAAISTYLPLGSATWHSLMCFLNTPPAKNLNIKIEWKCDPLVNNCKEKMALTFYGNTNIRIFLDEISCAFAGHGWL